MKAKIPIALLPPLMAWLITYLMYLCRQVQSHGGFISWCQQNRELPNLMPQPLIVIGVAIVSFAIAAFVPESELDKVNKQRAKVARYSKEKWKAMHPPIPKANLCNTPEEMTVGVSRKGLMERYINLYSRYPGTMLKHLLIIGLPGMGKSQVLKSLLLYQFNDFGLDKERTEKIKYNSCIVFDIKPELSYSCVHEDQDNIRIIKPTSIDSEWGFDIDYNLTKDSDDEEIIERYSKVSRALIPDLSSDNAHFSKAAQSILVGFLAFNKIKGLNFGESMMRINSINTQDFISEILLDEECKQHPLIAQQLREFEGNDSEEMQSIQDCLHEHIKEFSKKSVIQCFGGNKNKVVPQDLLNGISVFIQIEDRKLDDFKFIFGLILELTISYLMSVPEVSLKGKGNVAVICDEAGRIYVPSILDLLALGRSKHLRAILIIQSYQQLISLYGKEKAETITDTCAQTLVLSCHSISTAEDLSKRTGFYKEEKISKNRNATTGANAKNQENASSEFRTTIDVSDIYALEGSNQILVFDTGRFWICEKKLMYQIPQYKKKSEEIEKYNLKNYQKVDGEIL